MAVFLVVIASFLIASSLLHRWFKRLSVKHVQGPPSPSFWLGHQRVLRDQENAGDLETKWRREYGNLYRIGGCLGQDVLVVCDPKALAHIFHPSRPYPKSKDAVFILGLVAGKGLAIVTSETHHRQRKILNLAFSPAQLRISQVIFQQCSDKLVNGIKGSLVGGTDATVNIRDWMGKVTLDIIAAFRYDFSTLDGQRTELGTAMKHLFTASQTNTTALELILIALIRMLPNSMLGILRLFSTREIRQLVSVGNMAKRNAREILANHNDGQIPEGDGDIISVLGNTANVRDISSSTTCSSRCNFLSRSRTFVIAGHETSSTSLCWLLYELAVHPEHQSIIRAELKGSNDYDSMPFLNAVIKEALRLYPVAHSLMRTAPHDDVLPLSGGKTLAVPKGQTFVCSAYLYNRQVLPMSLQPFSSLPSLWGDDAEEWNPARFLDKALPVSLGVYANLMSFISVYSNCSMKYRIMEMQTIIANLILHFEFSLPEGDAEILRFPSSPAVVPIVKGKAHLGSQLPLRVKVLQ
ncbi:cytochrome P450 [Armillaria novae-zelandiae]|uniref:Cytochrome P450 n=1 Tax=Armillaria novae-zelandiae TaxID=153914 RepID=A0AA39P1A1_9AGAR|nr:cytochrome P450 [Armillaria novae-zelandiae]